MRCSLSIRQCRCRRCQSRDTCGKCGARRVDRQIGLEPTPDEYLATMVAVFREVRRVLRPDGTCWVNMGDSYVSHKPRDNGALTQSDGFGSYSAAFAGAQGAVDLRGKGYKSKDLLMMPARLALALQAGWVVGAFGHHLAQAEPDAGELPRPADERA